MNGLFPVFDQEIPGVSASDVDGRALDTELDALATRLGVTSLFAFIDGRKMLIEALGSEAPVPDDIPPVQWYAPAEELRTARALLNHLATHPNTLREDAAATAIADLQALEATLLKAEAAGARFHLLVDV